jgi:hypothetical protein
MPQCTAKSKRSQQRCRKDAMRSKTVCAIHGGKTPTGYGLPQTTLGRYSKVIPLRLAARYEEARTNKDLLSVRDDIALAESRLADLFSRVDSGESGAIWQALGAALEAFHRAMTGNDLAAMQGHLATMRRLIAKGADDYAAWSEIQKLWDTRCRLTQTETKTLITMQQMVTTEQLMLFFGSIAHAVQDTVTAHADPLIARQILGELSGEFQRISNLEAN